MSKARDAHRQSQLGREKLQPASESIRVDIAESSPPLKAQRALFILFGITLILLLMGMLALYFKTVYPNRDKPQIIETDTPTTPTLPQ